MATEDARTGRIVWHELQTADVDGARRFYGELLGWQIDVWKPEEADYPMIHVDGAAHGGFQRTHPDGGIPPHWVPYVRVDDADAVAAKARELGGSVRVEPLSVRDVGRLTFVVDGEGAEIAALTPGPERPRPEGVFGWDELLVEDVDTAKRVYTELFGWSTAEAMEGYTLFQAGEEQVAGLAARPNLMPAPAWLTYLATDEIDGTLSRARELGATVVFPIRQTENVGRYAAIEDPGGAIVGLLEPER
jgi:predicted enzyme related to lactoylglutathione lyase